MESLSKINQPNRKQNVRLRNKTINQNGPGRGFKEVKLKKKTNKTKPLKKI